jgi:uncharacterized membrane protein YqiK
MLMATATVLSSVLPPILALEGWQVALGVLGAILLLLLLTFSGALGMRYIPNNRLGIIEKMWSAKGSVSGGRIIANASEAGYQSEILRGGLHFFYWRWQYRIHTAPLVTIPQGKIGYIYARDGQPLPPSQTLGQYADCNHYQDAEAFLSKGGQRGRQRAILREGVYAINLALFVVITEDVVYHLEIQGKSEVETLMNWQKELREVDGFSPILIGGPIETIDPLNPKEKSFVDSIGIITIHDGPSLAPGEIIAPAVGNDSSDPHFHNNYQDPEAFLAGGGRRGRQYVPLTDGTYFINRWFASIEYRPKAIVPIGYVGVVISYYGPYGKDLSGDQFRHGERVARGERGVWEKPLGPGKYPFNTYAGQIVLVPTTNFVLHWITGRTEAHHYDDSLQSIAMVTKDAYEPTLPLSVVVHIDYMKAPSVIQRFGDVKKLITQTLDPMLSAYFRDVAHRKTMLEILQQRAEIQKEGRQALQERFNQFDIECVDVLIGKPDTAEAGGKIEILLEQLRQRQLSVEQLETFARQSDAAEKLRVLNEKQALAAKQQDLTNSQVQIRIAENQSEAELAKSRKQAEQTVVVAEAELARSRRQAEQAVVTAQAESQSRILAGRGEAQRILQVGLAEAATLMQKVNSFGDPRLYALTVATDNLSKSTQPLVPGHLFVSGGNENGSVIGGQGLLGTLINLFVAEKSGFTPANTPEIVKLREFIDRMSSQAIEGMQAAACADAPTAASAASLADAKETARQP